MMRSRPRRGRARSSGDEMRKKGEMMEKREGIEKEEAPDPRRVEEGIFVAVAGAAEREKKIGKAAGMLAFGLAMAAGNALLSPAGSGFLAIGGTVPTELLSFGGLTAFSAGAGIALALLKYQEARKAKAEAIADLVELEEGVGGTRREIVGRWKAKAFHDLLASGLKRAMKADGKSDPRKDQEIIEGLHPESRKIPDLDLFSMSARKKAESLIEEAMARMEKPAGPKPG